MKIIDRIFRRIMNRNVEAIETESPSSLSQNTNYSELNEESINYLFINQKEKVQVMDKITIGEINFSELDPLFEDAARLIIIHQQGSTSLIQRKFSIGYNRAGRIIDQLENARIIGPIENLKARVVLIKSEEELEFYFRINCSPKMEDIYVESKSENEKRQIEIEKSKQMVADREEKEKIKLKILEKERIKRLEKEAYLELLEEGMVHNAIVSAKSKK